MKLLWRCFFLFFICSCQLFEGKVTVNEKSTVVYQRSEVDGSEAKRLGAVLLDYGYFNTLDKRTVYLRKKNNQYRVTFILNKEQFLSDRENMIEGFKVWQQWLQEQAFGYAPTLLILADEENNLLDQIDK